MIIFNFISEFLGFNSVYSRNCIDSSSSRQLIESGLLLIENFINEDEENKVFNFIQSLSDEQSLKNRRVYHFGYRFQYGSNSIDLQNPAESIPDFLIPYIDRIMDLGKVKHRPNQLTVNIYEAGQGIPLHVDTHSAFEDAIISLSSGSDV